MDRPDPAVPLNDERGASLILIAFAMLVFMGFAALAVDAGIAYEDRRQQQAAADVGSLAAAQFAKTGLPTTNCGALSGAARAACRGAEEAIAVVEGTLPGRYDLAAWAACTDPSPLTRVSSLSPCISFTSNFQRARVLLPGTDVSTRFARVLGFESIRVTAFAEAQLDLDISADVLPFAVGPSGAGQNQTCLKANTTQNLDVAPCDGPDEGNFGMLDVSLYGNATYGTPEICGNAMSSTKIAVNIVMGVDHPLETAGTTAGTVNDFSNCPFISNVVDNLATQTGNTSGGIVQGLWGGISTPTREGRITCKDGDANEGPKVSPTGSWPCVNVNNQIPETLDNTPLWHYLESTVTEVSPAGACDSVSDRQEMEICLEAWRDYGAHPATSFLFVENLETAPRFGAVPTLEDDPSNGTGDYDIDDFLPTYVSTIYLGCNANTCDIVYSPGESSTGACPNPLTPTTNSCGWFASGNKNLRALTGYMLRRDMLHPNTRENFPGSQGTV
ncbi:MAG: Tad domain-containing protein, partial [Actinobacteria bacterium]|nr:Tad domain-containing protein [Actinomycetota bacterium]